MPLVVKFADARKKDSFANGLKRGILPDPWQDGKRQLGGGMADGFLQVCMSACTCVCMSDYSYYDV